MVARKTSRTLGYILLGLVMIGLIGFGSTNFGGSVSAIGTVGDTEIDANRYFRELNNELQAFQAATGQALPFAQAQAFGLDRQVLSRVIATTALDNETARVGLSVGDEVVRDRILKIPDFQGVSGTFDKEAYDFLLQQNGLTASEFESGLRADLARGILQTAVAGGAVTAPVYTDTLFAYAREARDFTWAKLGLEALETPPPAPDDATLAAYFEAHAGDYTLPEIKQLTYAWLKPEALLDQIDADEDALHALYDENIDTYRQPERRLVERLVFANEDEAQAAMDAIAAGETDFATLAGDRGLTLQDLDLGDVTRADLGAAADVIFALTEPGIAGPAPSALGPAIFRMNAILAAQETPFETVRDELLAQYAGDRARRMILDQMTEIDDHLAGGATLEELTDIYPAMEVASRSWRLGDDDGLAAYDEFRDAVATAQEGDFPELIALEDGGVFALRIDGVEAPRQMDLDEVRTRVAADWRADESLALLTEQAKAMLPVLESGRESLSSLGLTEIAEADQTRDGFIEGTPPELMVEVFAMQPGDWQVLEDQNGVVLVRLDAIKAADQDSDEAVQVKAAFSERTAQEIALDMENAFAQALQTQAGITLDQPMIDAIHRQFP